jgi:hypothetical protein
MESLLIRISDEVHKENSKIFSFRKSEESKILISEKNSSKKLD